MATTSPDSLRTPDPSDPYNLVADMATLAGDVQSALVKRGNMYVGTSAQRTAFTSAPEGVHWQDTNGDKSEWVRQSGSWVEMFSGWKSVGYGPVYTAQSFGYNPSVSRVGGICHLRGTALRTSGNVSSGDSPLSTLPVGFRPSQVTYFITRGAGNSAINGQINADGTVYVNAPQNGTSSWISFDNVSFSL